MQFLRIMAVDISEKESQIAFGKPLNIYIHIYLTPTIIYG